MVDGCGGAMTADDFIKLLGQGGITGALLFILGRVVWRIAERLIQAIDRLGAKVDEHTIKDLEHHAEVRESVTRLEGRIDGILDERERTPVNHPMPKPRARTNPLGVTQYRTKPRRDDTEH